MSRDVLATRQTAAQFTSPNKKIRLGPCDLITSTATDAVHVKSGERGKKYKYIYHPGIIGDDESIERRTVGREDEGGRAGSGGGEKAAASRSFSSSSLWRPPLGLQAASAPPPLLVSLSLSLLLPQPFSLVFSSPP